MPRKQLSEAEKASTEFSDAFFKGGFRTQLAKLAHSVKNAVPAIEGNEMYAYCAIRDACEVVLAEMNDAKFAADSEYLKELRSRLEKELRNA